MKINQNTKLIAEDFTLVPYLPKHVEKYHNWMKSQELQELTASEPLSIEKEYEMQKSWREDDDKLTFIILSNDSGSEIDRIGLFLVDCDR